MPSVTGKIGHKSKLKLVSMLIKKLKKEIKNSEILINGKKGKSSVRTNIGKNRENKEESKKPKKVLIGLIKFPVKKQSKT